MTKHNLNGWKRGSNPLQVTKNKIINMKTILLKIDEDNDIFEMSINNEVYTLDNVYQSKYGNLFDELNMAIEIY